MFCAEDKNVIGAKMGFCDPDMTVFILRTLGFDLNACNFLLCEVMGENFLPRFEIPGSA